MAYRNQMILGKKYVEAEVRQKAKSALCAWKYYSTHGVYLLTIKLGAKRLKEKIYEEQLADCVETKGVQVHLKKLVSNTIKAFEGNEREYEKHLCVSERLAVKSFTKKVRSLLGNSLLDLRMFGSKIAGIQNMDSDIDILLVIESEDWRVRESVSNIAADINIQYGSNISPVIYTKTEYDKNRYFNTLFVREVEKDGVLLG